MTKTKDGFTNPQAEDWWLVEANLSTELEQRRHALGAAHGWNYATWYEEPAKLEQLYEWLAANRTELLDVVEYADDEAARARWLDDFVEAVSTEEATEREEESSAPGEGRDEETQGEATSPAPTEPVGSAKKSLFAGKPVEEERVEVSAAHELLDQTDLPPETKQVLEEYITNSAVPVDRGEVEDLLKEFPDDFEKVFEEAREGLEEEIDSFLSDLEEDEEEGDEGEDEDDTEEVEA